MTQKKQTAFDNSKYLREQIKAIKARAKKFKKIYFEFGGRLLYDGHAERVLPGYNPKNKLLILKKLKKQIEIIYCISSRDVQKGEAWSNTGLNVIELVLKETREMKKNGLKIAGIAITRFNGQEKVLKTRKEFEKTGYKVFFTFEVNGYPKDFKEMFSKRGFDAQEYLPTKKKIIVITGAGANSGKMFTALSQLYHDNKHGINSGYAKFETFPIWNLPKNHEVNLAYEAATADLQDKVMVDKHHLHAYKIKAVNYNRDIENFGVMQKIISKIVNKNNYMRKYKSPTDMGVNMAKFAIIDDKVVKRASREEIYRRKEFFRKKVLDGEAPKETMKRIREILTQL